MDAQSAKYFIDGNFIKYPDDRWFALLDLVLPNADYLELNTLYRGIEHDEALNKLRDAMVTFDKSIKRVYKANFRFRLTAEVIEYVKEKSFKDWHSFAFEDPAFYSGEQLLLGTVTHEYYAVMLLDEPMRKFLNENGYDFVTEINFQDEEKENVSFIDKLKSVFQTKSRSN